MTSTSTSDGPQGTQCPQVTLAGPEFGPLADLDSVAQDLAFAQWCAVTYIALEQGADAEGEPTMLQQALWHAAVMAHRRATDSGRALVVARGSRPRLDAELVGLLSEGQRQIHEEARSVADQHVAHRVSNLEQARVLAVLEPPPGEPKVLGLATFLVRMVGTDVKFAEGFAEICGVFVAHLRAEFDRNCDALIESLNARADLAKFYPNAE